MLPPSHIPPDESLEESADDSLEDSFDQDTWDQNFEPYEHRNLTFKTTYQDCLESEFEKIPLHIKIFDRNMYRWFLIFFLVIQILSALLSWTKSVINVPVYYNGKAGLYRVDGAAEIIQCPDNSQVIFWETEAYLYLRYENGTEIRITPMGRKGGLSSHLWHTPALTQYMSDNHLDVKNSLLKYKGYMFEVDTWKFYLLPPFLFFFCSLAFPYNLGTFVLYRTLFSDEITYSFLYLRKVQNFAACCVLVLLSILLLL